MLVRFLDSCKITKEINVQASYDLGFVWRLDHSVNAKSDRAFHRRQCHARHFVQPESVDYIGHSALVGVD